MGTLARCWWERKTVKEPWATVWKFPKKKSKIELPCSPAIALPGAHRRTEIMSRERYLRPRVHAAHSQQPRSGSDRPPLDEWIHKMRFIRGLEYHAALKRKDILPGATTWTSLEDTMLKTAGREETGAAPFHTARYPEGSGSQRQKRRAAGARGRGWALLFNGYRISVL